MFLFNHYAIRPPIPKTIFVKRFLVEIMAFPFALFQFQFLLPFPSAILCCISTQTLPGSCHNVFVLLSLSGVTNLIFLAGVCEACSLAYKCLQTAVTVVAIPSQKSLLMCPYVSSGKFPVLALHCSRAPWHNLQPTSDRRLIFAGHSATGMVPAIPIISRLLCLQGTRGSFKYLLKNDLLSFGRNVKFAVHVTYAE